MFKNLRTRTKLFALCAVFIATVGVTTYSLVAEKMIAIEFAQKELLGNAYLSTINRAYATMLTGKSLEADVPDNKLTSTGGSRFAVFKAQDQ